MPSVRAIAASFPDMRPAAGVSRLCSVLIDAEEDFDWARPLRGVPHDVDCMRRLTDFQGILAAYGAVPTYMLTYPVLRDAAIVAALRGRLARGLCRLGIQLHTWVTPPFEEAAETRNSFAGNLPSGLEERKLVELKRLFEECFGEPPTIFRAGRYGLSVDTPALLERHGFLVDTSIAPCTSFAEDGGPDFSASDYFPFWFGRGRRLLELPLCRSIAGWGGRPARLAYRRLTNAEHTPPYAAALLAWTRCAERITLSPEGNDVSAAERLVANLMRRGETVLALSMHSSSFSVGHNPYVHDKAGLHGFYDRLSAMLDMLSGRFAVRFVAAPDLPGLLPDLPGLPEEAAPASVRNV
jgi:hypothetical protein